MGIGVTFIYVRMVDIFFCEQTRGCPEDDAAQSRVQAADGLQVLYAHEVLSNIYIIFANIANIPHIQ